MSGILRYICMCCINNYACSVISEILVTANELFSHRALLYGAASVKESFLSAKLPSETHLLVFFNCSILEVIMLIGEKI